MHGAIRSHTSMDRIPAPAFFLISAIFHYLGPACAVLLFAHVDVLGVAWLRVTSAAAILGSWRPGSRRLFALDRKSRWIILGLGAVLAAMNSFFYLAVARLPLATVGAIEFLGTVVLAAYGSRTPRNIAALGLTIFGVAAITQVRFSGEPMEFVFAFANGALFVLYIMLGHHIANRNSEAAMNSSSEAETNPLGPATVDNMDQLAASMLVAAVLITPVGLAGALPTFSNPVLLLAGVGVGVCSSVIPYITDQLAMARLSRATFALMLALLPVFATVIGAFVLRQIPTIQDCIGIALVTTGVALHRQEIK